MIYSCNDGQTCFAQGRPEFPVSFRFPCQIPQLDETAAPGLISPIVVDAGRSWSGTQSMSLKFTEAVTTDGTGWTATVNGVTKTFTYVSGSGTDTVIFSLAATIHDNDVVRLSYDPATGSTASVTGSVEINKLVGVMAPLTLSKRIHFTLCNSLDAVVSESVKAAIFEYNGGSVTDGTAVGAAPGWMTRANAATVTTDGSGTFDMQYTGVARGGSTVYVAVIRAVESLIVATTVL